MFEADINYLAVLLGAVAAQPLGALWYGALFAGPWTRARGYDEVGEGTGNEVYVLALALHLVVAYTLARLVDMVGADSVGDCIAIAAFVWAGFAGTVQATQIVFSDAKQKLTTFAIEGGYQFASFLVIGLLVGLFQ